MRFDIIEQISLAGSQQIANEDRLGVSSHLTWVIDGATDLGPAGLMGSQSGSAWFASNLGIALASKSLAISDDSITGIFEAVIGDVADMFVKERLRDPKGKWEIPSAAFLALVIQAGELHAAWSADCVCLQIAGENVSRIGEGRASKERIIAERDIEADHSQTTLRRERELPDRAAITAESQSVKQVRTVQLECEVGDEFVLMTDGFAALFDDYDMAYEDFVRHLRLAGLAELGALLREIEAEDPTASRFPRIKKSDDATAIRLRLAE